MSELSHDAEAAVVRDLALASGEPRPVEIDQPSVLVVPEGAATALLDVSEWREGPVRPRACYKPATVAAFSAVAKLHLNDSSTVWVHPTSGRVEAVFDDNAKGAPRYREHRAVLQLLRTPEWEHWTKNDGKLLTQEDFALHIEEGLQEIEQPDAADMLEMAQSFRMTNNASFRTATRLASGEQQFLYDETVEAKAGRSGELTVPAVFVLLLAPFVGEAEVQVTAKLRYRMSGGSFAIGYKLERPDKVVRDALDGVAEQLAGEFPRVFVGEPA